MVSERTPCDQCRRVHRGPRCKPDEARSVTVAFTFPAHLARELRESVFYGDRSGFVAAAVERALEEAS